MSRANSQDRQLRERAEAVIPGGMFGHQSVGLLPDDYPQFFAKGDGAHITDVDGNRYLDFMCAYGPNLFGYGHPKIDAAFVRQLGQGEPRQAFLQRVGAFRKWVLAHPERELVVFGHSTFFKYLAQQEGLADRRLRNCGILTLQL